MVATDVGGIDVDGVGDFRILCGDFDFDSDFGLRRQR